MKLTSRHPDAGQQRQRLRGVPGRRQAAIAKNKVTVALMLHRNSAHTFVCLGADLRRHDGNCGKQHVDPHSMMSRNIDPTGGEPLFTAYRISRRR
jgi:hypothetical protein